MYVCIHAFCVTSDYGRLTTIITMSRPALNHGLGVRRCHPRTTRCLLSPLSLSLSLLSPNQGLGAAISAARTTVLTTVLLYYCALTYAIISLHRQSMRHEPSRAQEADSPNHPQAHSCWQDSDYWMRPDICAEISNTSTY
jgi:hypothetical protein